LVAEGFFTVTVRVPVEVVVWVVVVSFAPAAEVVATASAAPVSVAVEALTWADAVAATVDWDTVLPVIRPLEASDRTLDEMDRTAVTGQTTSVKIMTSVTVTVLRASVGKLAKSSVLAGQSMTSGRHEVMVRIEVVDTVRVVIPEAVALVGNGAAVVTKDAASDETPVDSGTVTDPVVTAAAASVAASVAALEAMVVPFLCLGWRRR
jgi:hypothetical protein